MAKPGSCPLSHQEKPLCFPHAPSSNNPVHDTGLSPNFLHPNPLFPGGFAKNRHISQGRDTQVTFTACELTNPTGLATALGRKAHASVPTFPVSSIYNDNKSSTDTGDTTEALSAQRKLQQI